MTMQVTQEQDPYIYKDIVHLKEVKGAIKIN